MDQRFSQTSDSMFNGVNEHPQKPNDKSISRDSYGRDSFYNEDENHTLFTKLRVYSGDYGESDDNEDDSTFSSVFASSADSKSGKKMKKSLFDTPEIDNTDEFDNADGITTSVTTTNDSIATAEAPEQSSSFTTPQKHLHPFKYQTPYMQSKTSNLTLTLTNSDQPSLGTDFVTEFNYHISSQSFLTIDQYHEILAGDIGPALESASSAWPEDLITLEEIAFYSKNKVPSDSLLHSKYFLFKILNSKKRSIQVQNPKVGNSFSIHGEFLSPSLFLSKACWSLSVLTIKDCKIKEKLINELTSFLNSMWKTLESHEAPNLPQTTSTLIYYKKLLSAYNVYDRVSSFDDESVFQAASDNGSTIANTISADVGSLSINDPKEPELLDNTELESINTKKSGSKKQRFPFKLKRKSKKESKSRKARFERFEKLEKEYSDQSKAENEKEIEIEKPVKIDAKPFSINESENLSISSPMNTTTTIHDKFNYYKSITSLFEIVCKITNHAIRLKSNYHKHNDHDLYRELVFVTKILSFFSKYVVQFIVIDAINMIQDQMKFSSDFLKSGVTTEDLDFLLSNV